VPQLGPESITVPGALAGWTALLERFGRMTLAEVLEPAIRLADEGFPVSPIIAREWAARTPELRLDAGSAATFLDEGGCAPSPGAWFRNPDQARSLGQISAAGAAAFYGGELGRRVVDGVRSQGGFLTHDDLLEVRAEWVEPVSSSLGGIRLHELPPPGQGIAALQMLRLVEDADLRSLGHNSAKYLHHLIEVKKVAYADLEAYIGDPEYMNVPLCRLLDEDYLASRRRLVDARVAAERFQPGEPSMAGDTVYLAAADAEGNMVSFINSLYGHFGSGVTVPGTGFALQNRGAGFTLSEGHPNMAAPRKRPFHTLVPAFATRSTADGEEPWMAFGVMGGSMQPQGHIQVLLNMLVFGMDPQSAIEAPRFRHLRGRRVQLEPGIGASVREALSARGHEVVDDEESYGGAQLVARLPRGWVAASDPRKDGHAAGM
jgi:gamma-glutamyltranspeptidase / glutathione hydrolase